MFGSLDHLELRHAGGLAVIAAARLSSTWF